MRIIYQNLNSKIYLFYNKKGNLPFCFKQKISIRKQGQTEMSFLYNLIAKRKRQSSKLSDTNDNNINNNYKRTALNERLSVSVDNMFKESDYKAFRKEYERTGDPVTKEMLYDSYHDMIGALNTRLQKTDRDSLMMCKTIDNVHKCIKQNKQITRLERKLNKKLDYVIDGLVRQKECQENIVDNLDYIKQHVDYDSIDPINLIKSGEDNTYFNQYIASSATDTTKADDHDDDDDNNDNYNLNLPSVPITESIGISSSILCNKEKTSPCLISDQM